MKRPTRPVRGTILRNRPVFSGRDEVNDPVTGHVRFSRPLRSPGSVTPHFRVAVDLSDGRVAKGYWTPGRPADLIVRT